MKDQISACLSSQVHFEERMFEQNRQDGIRKLKPNAVPTIFSPSQETKPPRRILKRVAAAEPTATSSTGRNKVPRCKLPSAATRKIKSTTVLMPHVDHVYAGSSVTSFENYVTLSSLDVACNMEIMTTAIEQPVASTMPSTPTSSLPPTDPNTSTMLSTPTSSMQRTNLNIGSPRNIITPRKLDLHQWKISHLQEKVRHLTLEKQRLRRENAVLRAREATTQRTLQRFLSPDQMQHLHGNKTYPWSADTIKRGLQTRAATGKNGYEFVRLRLGIPLPSYRSLCDHTESFKMAQGMQDDVLDLLELKAKQLSVEERDCVLLLDEVQLEPKVEYDTSLKRMTGYISPEFLLEGREPTVAEHALVFMVKGIRKPYKQPIAWFLTGKSTTGTQLWSVTKQVIEQLCARSLCVRVVTSDMGPANVGMWRQAGLNLNDEDNTACSITHPCVQGKRLYFMADVPHLLKSVRNCLENSTIVVPMDVVEANNLPSREIKLQHVSSIVDIQETYELKLVPGLSRANIHPGQYGKMKVGNSTKVFSHTSASVLNDLVKEGIISDNARTTAWFCELMNSWFDIMSNRSYPAALFSTTNSLTAKHVDKLNDVLNIISRLQVMTSSRGLSEAWKPWQKGILLSTRTILALHDELVQNGNYSFLLTCRFTQDALENLFSQIRGFGDDHPSTLHFRQCLKLITLSQFMDVPKKTSYEVDDTPNLIEFIKSRPQKQLEDKYSDLPALQSFDGILPNIIEEKSLYNLAGWVSFKVLRKVDACQPCVSILRTDDPQLPQSSLVKEKSYGALVHPSNEMYSFIFDAEWYFRSHDVRNVSIDEAADAFLHQCKRMIGNCHLHELSKMVVRKFFKVRMHIRAKFLTQHLKIQQSQFASRSAAARTTVR
jgi:hypothetical protein